MTNLKFLILAVFGGFQLVAVSGCESGSGIESGGEFTGQQTETSLTGRYKLETVNDVSIPGVIVHRLSQLTIHAGEMTIRADGTCTASTVATYPGGGKENRISHCRYERSGSKLDMQWEGAGKTTGLIEGEKFTMDNHGMDFVFQRSQPISSMETLDLSTECDAAVIEAGVTRAETGVFDDFGRVLKSGRNNQGDAIGFLTFQDSPTTRVAMSTTGKHPPRDGEANSNSVLQLDLDVRAWAGVIHAFENPEVTRWTPRDWRGKSELRFWFHGNNRQTSLFVEVLDNRKPCPGAAGAEVYTYQFTDDFKGWKQIVVPFNRFARKEIYNDAPNDGLGLSEVHGWAFGTLDTGGPTTYYLDDFEIR